MNITESTKSLVYEAIRKILADAGDPAELIGVSCIARGADTVFAQAVLDAGGNLEVVLPSRKYRERKVKPDHATQFDTLIEQAAEVRVMDFDDAGREAYEAANEAVVGTCDQLIAVWDSQISEKGGTGTVVELAREKSVPVIIVWPDGAERD
ncbi:hypothetical protein ACFVMC_00155 [Nocardia sp. NPDC127579]|uniref:hypothetical protein n=1 Tax=Nocardia sp. NPDC127579 TaxID=3345402 RepID=UPI003633C774